MSAASHSPPPKAGALTHNNRQQIACLKFQERESRMLICGQRMEAEGRNVPLSHIVAQRLRSRLPLCGCGKSYQHRQPHQGFSKYLPNVSDDCGVPQGYKEIPAS